MHKNCQTIQNSSLVKLQVQEELSMVCHYAGISDIHIEKSLILPYL